MFWTSVYNLKTGGFEIIYGVNHNFPIIKKGESALPDGGADPESMEYQNVTVFDHPLIQHKLSILRSSGTDSKQFRELIREITVLMTYEATRDLPLEEVTVTTPVAVAAARRLSGEKLAVVPILRAGLGMVDGFLALIPSARVGHIGLCRDHETLEPREYYCKLPGDIHKRLAVVLDPMLATGGSADAALGFIKQRGCSQIKFMSVIAAPEGISRLAAAHPDVHIYCGCVDEGLNEKGYIVPGLGDAGDRIFGTDEY